MSGAGFREDGGECAEKLDVERRGYKKLNQATLDSPQLVIIIISSGGNGLLKSGEREVFVGRGVRNNKIKRLQKCISQQRGSAAAGESSSVRGDAVLIFIIPDRAFILQRW